MTMYLWISANPVVQKCGANFCCLHSLTSSRWTNFKRDFTACQTPWPLWHLAVCWGILATTSKEQVAALAEFLRVQDRKETLHLSMPTFEEERPLQNVFSINGVGCKCTVSHSATRLQQVFGTFDLNSLSCSVAGVSGFSHFPGDPPSVLVLISNKRWIQKPQIFIICNNLEFLCHFLPTVIWSPQSILLVVSPTDKNEMCRSCFVSQPAFCFTANVILCLWIVHECHSNVYIISENWICSDLMNHLLAKPFFLRRSRNENRSTVWANEDKEMCVNCNGAVSQKMYSVATIQGCQIILPLSKTFVKLRLLMQQLL